MQDRPLNMTEDGYPRHPRATGNRLKARVKYDYDTIHGIIDETPILHVSFPPAADDGFPIMLPMLGCTGLYDPLSNTTEEAAVAPGSFPTGDEKKPAEEIPTGPRSIYLHGHAASRLFQVTKDARIPTAIAASSMQGIVLSMTPFHNSCNYTSAVVHGYSSLVTDEAERNYALTIITDNLVAERWDNSRVPPTKAELSSTGVIKLEIESASAKIRVGWPSDDRADMRNDALMERVWTGVIPCWTQFGDPQPSSYNRVKRVPGYLQSFVQEQNEMSKQKAFDALAQGSK